MLQIVSRFHENSWRFFETQAGLVWVTNSLRGLKVCLILTKEAGLHRVTAGDCLPRFESRGCSLLRNYSTYLLHRGRHS